MKYVVSCDALADSSLNKLGLTVSKYYDAQFNRGALAQFCKDIRELGYEVSVTDLRNAKVLKEGHIDAYGEVMWKDEIGFDVQALFKGAIKTLRVNVYCLDL